MKLRIPTLATLLTSTALLSGCFSGDDSPTAAGDEMITAEEQAAIEFVMEEDETNSELTMIDVRSFDSGSGVARAPINTHRWFREPQSVDRNLEIIINAPSGEPATATVNASGTVIGLLHLWTCSADSLLEVTKDFEDDGKRSLMFVKSRRTDRLHRGWKLVSLSGVHLESPAATVAINSVRVQSGDVDQTLTNVTDLVAVEDLMRFERGAEVTLTVDTGDATDAVFLHVRRQHRTQFTSNDDGTFSATFFANDRPGARHFAVDVLSDGTLYDDTEAYDNVTWGIPYIVERLPNDGGDDEGGEDSDLS
ncbi:MAG: hypothetical protein HKN12_06415 [Gemmatimonadetes bacterium]|nr:hypothetical protein [Gemmatimonadota bacterium]